LHFLHFVPASAPMQGLALRVIAHKSRDQGAAISHAGVKSVLAAATERRDAP
jgi:hypothetical protein